MLIILAGMACALLIQFFRLKRPLSHEAQKMISDLGPRYYFRYQMAVAAAVGLMTGVAVAALLGAILPKRTFVEDTQELVSFLETEGADKAFFMDISLREGDPFGFYYVRTDQGFSPQSRFIDDRTSIIESDKKSASLRRRYWTFSKRKYWLLGVTFPLPHYEFVIPQAGIRRNIVYKAP
ncbi:MAG TPA: hypothetical protein VHF05_02940 [Candidatus Paceibacterota bacterium]|nr:hypothetical protein [Candidatus Paceibacterota bacterium]